MVTSRSSAAAPPGAREQWMLFHKRDEHAVDGWDAEDHPKSVKTGRTNDEVKASPAATWSSSALWNAPGADELAALDELPARGGQWEVGDHTLKLTNLDKVLIPAKRPHKAVTKRDLIRHYASIAPAILPYVAGRPINLHRYPDGIDEPGFWHKARPTHAPDWLPSWRNDDADPGETEVYSVLDSAAALAWAANFGAIELHPWTSTIDAPPRADLGDGRHRPRDVELVRGHGVAREAASHCARSDRRGGLPEVERTSRHPDLDTGG